MRVVIIEDEFFAANHIKSIVERFGVQVVSIYESGEAFLEETDWDFDAAFLDIFLAGDLKGIDCAKEIKKRLKSFAFITANKDAEALKIAADLNPKAYIVKPFRDIDVEAATQLLLSSQEKKISLQGSFGSKEVNPNDIWCIKTDKNYLNIHTSDAIYHQRNSLKEFIELLPDYFIQINRFCVINSRLIDEKTTSQVKIGKEFFAVSRNFKDQIKAL